MTTSKGLIIFVKNPVLGKVKTRLASTLGAEKALKIYKHLLNHTRKVSEQVNAVRFLFYSENINTSDKWNNDSYQKFVQEGSNLGAKIQNAFKTAFKKSQKNIIIGSDCLEITHWIINEAFAHLEKHDVVIGPAVDGGYYLLGINNYYSSLFEDIEWSSSKVLQQTIDKADSLNLRVKLLKELSDIDYEEDLVQYRI